MKTFLNFGILIVFLLASITSCGRTTRQGNANNNLRNSLNGSNVGGTTSNPNLNVNYTYLACPNGGKRYNLSGNLESGGIITPYTAPTTLGKSSIYINSKTLNKVEVQGAGDDRLIVKASVCVFDLNCSLKKSGRTRHFLLNAMKIEDNTAVFGKEA